jgi:hypothetical protein
MRTPDQYREFAAECYRLAAETKNDAHKKILREMARAWSELAEEVEAKASCRSAAVPLRALAALD